MEMFKVMEKVTGDEYLVLNYESKSEGYLLADCKVEGSERGMRMYYVESKELSDHYLFRGILK